MIVFGSKGRITEVGSGEFMCPRCQTQRPYIRKKAARYFTLYFIPVFKTKDLGEFVECQVCKGAFDAKTLEVAGPSNTEQAIKAVRSGLESGTPIHIMRKKLANSGINDTAAKKMVDLAVGNIGYKTCQNCGFMYIGTVNKCTNCDHVLGNVRA